MTDVIFFPGLAADNSLAHYHEAVQGRQHWIDWADPERADSLGEYAKLLSEKIPETHRPILIGISFGGLMALELANHLNARMVILVGSLTHAGEISRLSRAAGFLLPALPEFLFKPSLLPGFAVRSVFGIDKEHELDFFTRMARRFSGSFVKRLAGFVTAKSTPTKTICPVFRVHGRRDRIVSRPGSAELVLDGGHVISLTHAQEVNDFLNTIIASHSGVA